MTASSRPANRRAHISSSLLISRIVLAAVLVVLSLGAATVRALAQTPEIGQWQGSTEGEKPERVILVLPEGSAKQAVLYLLDEDNAAQARGTSNFELTKAGVSLALANIETDYRGSFAADHGSITGTWTVRGKGVPLTLKHVSGDAAWEIPHMTAAMPVTADPSFEVATIRLADPDVHGSGFQVNGTRIRAHNQNMQNIICFAYNIHRAQLVDAPSWFTAEKWEMGGVADIPGDPNLKQLRSMFRKLLAERLGLRLEEQTRDLSVYAVVKGKDAPRLTPSASKNILPNVNGNGNNGVQEFRYENITLDEFASELAYWEDRPFVNHTGLDGRYDFRLRWTVADTPTMDANAPPVLFTAIQEQLGLKVEAMHSPTQVYVVKHVDRPSAN
jgi:uncharacterized protein (TIGR03435 family)